MGSREFYSGDRELKYSIYCGDCLKCLGYTDLNIRGSGTDFLCIKCHNKLPKIKTNPEMEN